MFSVLIPIKKFLKKMRKLIIWIWGRRGRDFSRKNESHGSGSKNVVCLAYLRNSKDLDFDSKCVGKLL
jgi:hypothetical protein